MEEAMERLVAQNNYYELLNVSKTASTSEINKAYRRMSRMFHPDKHTSDPVQTKWAEKIFNNVKEAYDVLTDPHKRAIYDTLGKKGLEVDGWEMIVRTRTPGEIREEYERLNQEREERKLRQGANPKGSITIAINATNCFQKYDDDFDIPDDTPMLSNIEISSMNIQQAIDVPITLKDTITINGNVSAQNGLGNGVLHFSNRHINSSSSWTEYEFGIGNGPQVGFKVFRSISKSMFLNCGTALYFTPGGLSPGFAATLARQLDLHSVGYLTYKTGGGSNSSMSTIYVRDFGKVYVNVSATLGSPHSFISFNSVYRLQEYEMRLRLNVKIGTFGVLGEYGVEKKLSPNTSVSAAVSVGVPTGVLLKIKWVCSSQTLVFPIHLCEDIASSPIFYATVVPLAAYACIKNLILDPIERDRTERERQKILEANHEKVQERYRQSRATLELLQESYKRILHEETSSNGLIIVRAIYGTLPTNATNHFAEQHIHRTQASSPTSLPEVIDVTIPVQCLVRDSKLEIVCENKSELAGFYDPTIGSSKHLSIEYKYRGQTFQVTVAEADIVICPQSSHRVSIE